jgi:hypothetical protein
VKEVGYELNGYEGSGVSKGRLLHEQMHAKEIGFLVDGKVTFVHWWLLDIEVWETARFFSRGSSWRMWLAGEKVKEIDGNLQASWRYADVVSRRDLGRWKRSLVNSGWVVRKEDRGKRFVFLPTSWEQEQWSSEVKSRGLKLVGNCKSSKTGVYFLPKTHKASLSGRCIEAHGKGKNLRKASEMKAFKEFSKNMPWSCNSLEGFSAQLNRLGKGKDAFANLSGDVDKLFPSVHTQELLRLVKEKIGSKVEASIKKWLDSYTLSFAGKCWTIGSGLPIGHPWSPIVADFYLCCKEEKFVQWLEERGGSLARYVDDSVFSRHRGGSTPINELREKYETALKPLTVSWVGDTRNFHRFKQDLRVLDMDLSTMSRGWPTRGVTYAEKGRGLGGGCLPRSTWKGIARQLVTRLAEIESLSSGGSVEGSLKDFASGLWTPALRDKVKSWSEVGKGGVLRKVISEFKPTSRPKPVKAKCYLEYHPYWDTKKGRKALAATRCIREIRWRFSHIWSHASLLSLFI